MAKLCEKMTLMKTVSMDTDEKDHVQIMCTVSVTEFLRSEEKQKSIRTGMFHGSSKDI